MSLQTILIICAIVAGGIVITAIITPISFLFKAAKWSGKAIWFLLSSIISFFAFLIGLAIGKISERRGKAKNNRRGKNRSDVEI